MNIQREAIYKRRRNALQGDRLSLDLNNMFLQLTEELVMIHKEGGDFDTFREECIRVLGIDPKMDPIDFKEGTPGQILDGFQRQVLEQYARKTDQIRTMLLPACKDVYEKEGHRYKRIQIPFTDGRPQPLHIAATLQTAVESEGATIMQDIEKAVTLALLDDAWKEHLREMDELRTSVQAAQFKQKDPLVEYKIKAYQYFERFISEINRDVVSYLMKGGLRFRTDNQDLEQAKEQKTDMSKVQTNKAASDGGTDTQRRARAAAEGVSQHKKVETVRRQGKKVGRNDPCPCGSGKKFKQCHGRK
jgi:preprotein translocase subunit SecA